MAMPPGWGGTVRREGIEGLPDTYIPWLGTGAQVAQNEKEAAEIYTSLPKGSRADQQRLVAERGGRDEEKDPLGKKDRRGR